MSRPHPIHLARNFNRDRSADPGARRGGLTIEDDGPGFGGRNPESLFEKFERGRLESPVSGVGLRLAICRAIARLHDGDIQAQPDY
jgi:two-component system sensor histidine kinase KdpD